MTYLSSVQALFQNEELAGFHESVREISAGIQRQVGLRKLREEAMRKATRLWSEVQQSNYNADAWKNDRIKLVAYCFIGSGAKAWADTFQEEVASQQRLYTRLVEQGVEVESLGLNDNDSPADYQRGMTEKQPAAQSSNNSVAPLQTDKADPRDLSVSLDHLLTQGLKTSAIGRYTGYIERVVNGKSTTKTEPFDTPSLDEICEVAGLFKKDSGRRKLFKRPISAPGKSRAILDVMRNRQLLTGTAEEFIQELSARYALGLESVPQSTEAQRTGSNQVYANAKRKVEDLINRWDGHCPRGENYEKIGLKIEA